MEPSAARLSVTLRKPKPMVMQSKMPSAKGRRSTSACRYSTLPTRPTSISRSRPRHTFEAEVGGAFVAHVGRVQARWTHSIRSGIARSVRRAIVVAFCPARCAESPPLRGSCARSGPGIEVSGPLSFGTLCVAARVASARPALEVARPLRLAFVAELVQVLPRVEPGVVSVVEDELHGVLPHRLDGPDPDVLFAEHQHLLPGAVPFHLRRRGVHPQVLERQLEAATAGEAHLEHPPSAAQAELGSHGIGHR